MAWLLGVWAFCELKDFSDFAAEMYGVYFGFTEVLRMVTKQCLCGGRGGSAYRGGAPRVGFGQDPLPVKTSPFPTMETSTGEFAAVDKGEQFSHSLRS